MTHVQLVIMPEDKADMIELAVLRIWGPTPVNQGPSQVLANGGIYYFKLGWNKEPSLHLAILPRLFTNSAFEGCDITFKGRRRVHSPDKFDRNGALVREFDLRFVPLPTDIVFELKVIGQYRGSFSFTIRIEA